MNICAIATIYLLAHLMGQVGDEGLVVASPALHGRPQGARRNDIWLADKALHCLTYHTTALAADVTHKVATVHLLIQMLDLPTL